MACGSRPESELPPAATPGPAAALSETPAGTVAAAGKGGAVIDFFGDSGDGFGVAEPELQIVEDPRARREARVDGAIATLDPRRRVVELGDERAAAGVGPYGIASDGENLLYVTDVKLGAVLVFRARPELRLIRRYALPGGPTAIVYDREATGGSGRC